MASNVPVEPLVTVVIATHNRPAKLARLLHKVQSQDINALECIVVDDASSPETLAAYDELWPTLDDRFILRREIRSASRSGGPSQSRNSGITLARGQFVAFCDDDDLWIRDDHLSVAVRAMTKAGADLYLANMQTAIDGTVQNRNFYPVLSELAAKAGRAPIAGESDVYPVSLDEASQSLKHRIFHANTLVVKKTLLERVGLYWERISFAEDHDLSLRLADAAEKILFRPTVTAELDVSTHVSLARTFTDQDRLLFGILAVLHAESLIKNPGLRKIARQNRAWKLAELAQRKIEAGEEGAAREFVWQSLTLSPSMATLRLGLTLLKRKILG